MTLLLALALLLAPPESRPATERTLLSLIQRHATRLLEGYRLPTEADIQHDWAWVRKEERRIPYRIMADFDGDGRRDYAFVLLGVRPYWVRVVALVSTGGSHKAFQLREEDAGNEYSQHRYVVGVVPPGRYKALEASWFRLTHPAINVSYTESSDTFFIWDAKRGDFRAVAISD